MTTVVFAGGELEAFNRSSVSVIESANGAAFNATFARCAIQCSNANVADYAETLSFGSLATAWVHWDNYMPWGPDVNAQIIGLFNSTGTEVFRIIAASGTTIQAQYWNGAAWTNIGAAVAYSTALVSMDLKVVCGAGGSFELYMSNSLIASGAASMGSVNNIDKARLYCQSGTNTHNNFVSQVIAADGPTVGYKLYLKPPTGNSATNTAFLNDFTTVDELALDDSDFIQSSAAGDVETYTHAAIAIASGTVKAVVVSARCKNDGSAPANAQGALRIGGVNYFSGNLPGIGVGFGGAEAIFSVDPSTGVAWTTAAAGSAANEFGLKSAT